MKGVSVRSTSRMGLNSAKKKDKEERQDKSTNPYQVHFSGGAVNVTIIVNGANAVISFITRSQSLCT